MSPLPAFATIAGLCCLLLQLHPASSASLTANLKHVQIPNDTLNTLKSVNGTFLYVWCQKQTCHFTLDSIETSKSCDINLADLDPAKYRFTRYLTADKAILIWESKATKFAPYGTMVLTIVHFDDACKTYDIHILKKRTATVITSSLYIPVLNRNDGSFDIIYDDVDKCGDKTCKAGFDYQGQKIRDEVPWSTARNEQELLFAGDPGVYNLVPDSPEYGYLVHDGANTYITLWTKDDGNGPQTFLRNYTTEVPTNQFISGLRFSVAHKLLTACHHVENIPTKCEQVDFHNTSVIEPFDIVYSDDYNPSASSVHSLSGGGFLLGSIVGCPTHSSCCNIDMKKYVVTKYNEDGKKSGKIEIEGFECNLTNDNRIKSKLYEKEGGWYCLSQSCIGVNREHMDKTNMDLSITCFSDRDFS